MNVENQQGHKGPDGNSIVLSCEALVRDFEEGGRKLHVLRGLNFQVRAGERVAVIGESGVGKTTLLQLLGGLDLPTTGKVCVQGQDLATISDKQRGKLRNQALGFVYQFHHLLPEFSALENVAMPLLVRREAASDALEEAAELLQKVGLSERMTHRPGQLSGGERQRTAVARALITRPAVVLADEPTGNLDHATGERVFDLMLDLNREFGASLVVVTHDTHLAGRMDRTVMLENGLLVENRGDPGNG
ncbi:MAG: lipoprotein-releasing system ATP-binding protein LolD [Chromatiales bacterium]|nr:lipoprotein-releasing system ATP-binding protein LolD [Chromatiales bacterium]MDP6151560.1 lipoprotein-releasing ABC transporter ATP-binding protein LolD [Gammaproteobacteria bacterium]MDP7270042.1 lipoprotein-releasing ABC transporter ATP-binding protein LolD [Gammaproteobacteria bacterium]HJP03659.1 lipoprotein-releasing ABC transporter ATP-binding protein LolD [Gammaproteobacteria bacterium]